MTTLELFDPDSLEFRKRNLTDLVFWKQYADEKAEFHDSISKKTVKIVQEYRRRLSKIDGYKNIPLLRSFEAALSGDESQAEAMRSMSTSYGGFSRELQREMDKQCSSSEYEKEAIGYRKLVKLHKRTLKDVESDKDKIKNIAFKMDRISTNPDKNDKYEDLKHNLDAAAFRYDTNKECEVLLRGKVISKSEEIQQLWTEEEQQRLDVLLDGWKKCLNTENCINSKLLSVGKSKAMKSAENVDNGHIIEHATSTRMKSCTFKDFEENKKIIGEQDKHTEENEVREVEQNPPSRNKRRKERRDKEVFKSSSENIEHHYQLKDKRTRVSKTSSMKASDKSSLFQINADNKANRSFAGVREVKERKGSRQTMRCRDTDDSDHLNYSQERQSHKNSVTQVQHLTSDTDSSDDDYHTIDKSYLRKRKPVWSEDSQKPKARILPQVKISVSGDLSDSDEEYSSSDVNEEATVKVRRATLPRQKRHDNDTDNIAAARISRSDDDKLCRVVSLSKGSKYICAEDVLELRENAPRRLNQYIRMVAVSNYKANVVDETFSMKKGESIVMIKTPDVDGIAFGWKKIRLNTKTKYGRFPVQFVKIDTSVNQNLQKTLEQ